MTNTDHRPAITSRRRLEFSDIAFSETKSPARSGPPFAWVFSKNSKKRSAWAKHWIKDPIFGGLNSSLFYVFRLLPISLCSWIGAKLSTIARLYYQDKQITRRLQRNIRLLENLKGRSNDPRQTLLRWWKNTGRVHAEFSIVERLWSAGQVDVSNAEHLKKLLEAGKPIVLVSVHLGSWEGLAASLKTGFGLDMVGAFQPEPNRFTNNLIYKLRKKRRQYAFPPGRKSAVYLQRLITGGAAHGYIMIDEIRKNQVGMPLFGRPAPTSGNVITAIKLALSADATILPVFMARTNGARFQLTFLPSIELGTNISRAKSISDAVYQINEVFEPEVLRYMDQWYMLGNLNLPDNFAQLSQD